MGGEGIELNRYNGPNARYGERITNHFHRKNHNRYLRIYT
jgi:hypothetical protein